MKRLITLLTFSLALPLAAQDAATPAAPTAPGARAVASINGEVLTADQLDTLWNGISPARREQYEANGGKAAFLENYVRKHLLVQEALKKGFDKRPEVKADIESAKESVLFDRYVRDIVSATVIPDSEIRKYYDDNKDQFKTPEQLKIRHIVIVPNGAGPRPKSKEEAFALAKKVAMELTASTVHTAKDPNGDRVRERAFEAAAQQYSEDASAAQGGDLGWMGKGTLDPAFEEAAWALPIGTISGIVETRFGYHLIFVEGKRPAGVKSFEQVRDTIREGITTERASDVVAAVSKLTNELREASKIAVYPENIKQ